MIRVGWLADSEAYVGGAELTQAEFRAAAPEGVDVVSCPPGDVDPGCDRYVIHNCVLYSPEDLDPIAGRPTVKYWHDVGSHVNPATRAWLDRHAVYACCSPVQADYMGIVAKAIPPAVNLERFEAAADRMNGGRRGAVSVGSWRNYGKAAHSVAEWGAQNGGVDFFGGGMFAPPGSREVEYDAMPELLARYQTFVFLPAVIEPFGRLVAEAWAAGCEVVTNDLVGARYWIENDPDAMTAAPDDFWALVLS